MFKVKNTMPGSLSFGVENGSTTIGRSGTLDLDKFCSREFLKSSDEIQRLLRGGALVLVFDSEAKLPKKNLKAKPKKVPPRNLAPRIPPAAEKPLVVELNPEPVPVVEKAQEAPKKVEELVAKTKFDLPVVEDPIESAIAAKSEFPKIEEVEKLLLNDLKELAGRLGIATHYRLKSEILDDVLNEYEERGLE